MSRNGPTSRAPSAPSAPQAPRASSLQADAVPTNNANSAKVYSQPVNPPQFNGPFSGKGKSQAEANAMENAKGYGLTSTWTSGKADPRDAEYWRNFWLLSNQLGQGLNQISDQRSDVMTEYNRGSEDAFNQREDNRRSFARDLIGTGLLRSGYQNIKQTEGDTDYQVGKARRDSDYGTDLVRNAQARQDAIDAARAEEASYLSLAAQRQEQAQLDAAANDPGDYGGGKSKKRAFSKSGLANAPSGMKVNAGMPPTLKELNQRLARLRVRRANAKTPKQRQQIQKTIEKVRKNKNSLYGKRN